MIDPEKLKLSQVPDPEIASDLEIWNFILDYPADRIYQGWRNAHEADYQYLKSLPKHEDGYPEFNDVEKLLLFMWVRVHHAQRLEGLGPESRRIHRHWIVLLRELLTRLGDNRRQWKPTHRVTLTMSKGKTYQWLVMRTKCGLAYTEEEWAVDDESEPFWRSWTDKAWSVNRCCVGFSHDQVTVEALV